MCNCVPDLLLPMSYVYPMSACYCSSRASSVYAVSMMCPLRECVGTYPANASLGLSGEKQQQTGCAEVSSTFCGRDGSLTDQTHTRPKQSAGASCPNTPPQSAQHTRARSARILTRMALCLLLGNGLVDVNLHLF